MSYTWRGHVIKSFSTVNRVMQSSTQFRLSLLLLVVLSLILAAGCSRVKIAYVTADFLIERYADDYLGLDGTQISRWEPRLTDSLAKHRNEDLPYLAAFFQGALTASKAGFDQSNMNCLLDEFEEIYRRHLRIAAEAAAPLLADLNSEQIRDLETKFHKEDQEDQPNDSPEGKARRDRKRAERYTESTEWWIGSVTKRQQRLVADVTSRLPDTADDWARYRSGKRNGLIDLLDRNASAIRIQTYLTDWLVDYKDLPRPLRSARLELRARIAELFIRLDETFTPAQRIYLQDRLKTLRNDFMDLQLKPHMARVNCGRAS